MCEVRPRLLPYTTAGEEEAGFWTIDKGWTAPQVASVIHTDFEHGFIKAEIVSLDGLVEHDRMRGAMVTGQVDSGRGSRHPDERGQALEYGG